MRRRSFIVAGGTVIAGATTANILSQDAHGAEITMDSLSVSDQTSLVTDQVSDVRLAVDVSYSYTSNKSPDLCKLVLEIGTSRDSMYAIALEEHTENLPENESSETTLEASILHSPDFDLSQLNPNPGGSSGVYMYVGVRLKIVANNELQSEAYVEDFAEVTIENGSYEVSSSVGGTGGFEVVTEN